MYSPSVLVQDCAVHCGSTGSLNMTLLAASAYSVCSAGGKQAVTKQLPAPVAPPKQLQASGE